MKRFRKITALALTLVIIAMFGISASAAGSNTNINGDFGVGATFSWNLTTSEARANAVIYGAGEDHIDFQNHYIRIDYTLVGNNSSSIDDSTTSSSTQNYSITAVVSTDSTHELKKATYYYEARYIANDIVDCYLYHGPVTLINPS